METPWIEDMRLVDSGFLARVSASAFVTLIAMLYDDGPCPSEKRIAAKTKLHIHTVQKAIRELLDLGAISASQQRDDTGRWAVNSYILNDVSALRITEKGQPGVYVVQICGCLHKIGLTFDLEQRLKTLARGYPGCQLIHFIRASSRALAHELERYLHRLYEGSRENGHKSQEMFSLDDAQIAWLKSWGMYDG